MTVVPPGPRARLAGAAARLADAACLHRHDVTSLLDWPAELPADAYWFSPELLSCQGTDTWATVDEPTRVRLSHRELVNFFSVSVDLERELVAEVAARIYGPGFTDVSDFLFHFLEEENQHMWMFATFCLRYADGLYDSGWRSFRMGAEERSAAVTDLVTFGRILIAEDLCDWYNVRLADDERLPELVRHLNRVHHKDESRHLAFGRQLVRTLAEQASPPDRRVAGRYLDRYRQLCVNSLYNAAVYRDAGLANPIAVRREARSAPARQAQNDQLAARTMDFLAGLGVYA